MTYEINDFGIVELRDPAEWVAEAILREELREAVIDATTEEAA